MSEKEKEAVHDETLDDIGGSLVGIRRHSSPPIALPFCVAVMDSVYFAMSQFLGWQATSRMIGQIQLSISNAVADAFRVYELDYVYDVIRQEISSQWVIGWQHGPSVTINGSGASIARACRFADQRAIRQLMAGRITHGFDVPQPNCAEARAVWAERFLAKQRGTNAHFSGRPCSEVR